MYTSNQCALFCRRGGADYCDQPLSGATELKVLYQTWHENTETKPEGS